MQIIRVISSLPKYTLVLMLTFLLLPLVSFLGFFEAFDTAKWCVLYLLVSAAAVLSLRGKQVLRIPRCKLTRYGLIVTVILMILQAVSLEQSLVNKSVCDRAYFVLAAILFFNCSTGLKPYLTPLFAILSLPIALTCLWQTLTVSDAKLIGYISFFGNVNMGAQFLGLCALFLLLDFKKNYYGYFIEAALVAILTFIYFSLCRSVMLALLLSAPVVLWRNSVSRPALCRVFVLSFLAILFCRSFFHPLEMDTRQLVGKDNSSSYRLTLWRASVDMVRENPGGVGPGQFAYSVMPYKMKHQQWANPFDIDQFPHNEFVRILAQDGIALFVLIFFFISLLAYKIWKLQASSEKSLLLGIFVFLAIEAMLQFPLENAFPFLLMAWAVAAVFRMEGQASQAIPNWFVGICVAIILPMAGWYGVSEYWTRQASGDLSKMEQVCRFMPANWRGCMFYANKLIQEVRLTDAEEVLQSVLVRQPYHFPALRLLSQLQFRRNEWVKGCATLKKYDEVFGGKSPLHEWMVGNCKVQ